jgi:hypothetical protein
MEVEVTTQLAPLFWGVIALLLVLAGAILAGIDPEMTEVFLGSPRMLMASVALAFVALATVALARPELSASLRALLSN